MNIRAKTVTPILIALIAVLLVLTMSSLMFLKKEKDSNAAVEKRLEQTEKMVQTLQTKLDESNKLVLQLNESIKESDAKMVNLNQEMAQAREGATSLLSERDGLKVELEALKASKEEVLGKLTSAQKELEDIQAKLNTVTQEKEALAKKLKDLEAAGVQLDKIVVSYSESSEGQVMTVNKEYNFVVTNLGQRDNIQVGQPLYLYQGDKLVGELKVEKVENAMSVATPQGPDIISVVKEGDIVKTKK